MKKKTSRPGVIMLMLLLVSAGSLLSACSSTGGKAAGSSSGVCPLCGDATTQAMVKDMMYTKCVCPDCKTVSTIDPHAPASMRDYLEPGAAYVHVCDTCDCMVAACPACRGK